MGTPLPPKLRFHGRSVLEAPAEATPAARINAQRETEFQNNAAFPKRFANFGNERGSVRATAKRPQAAAVQRMIAPLHQLGVVPILVGPLQVFLAMLPAILFGIGSALLALFKPATFKLALRLLWRMKVSIIVAIVLVSGTVFAARAVWRSATGAVGQTEAGAHDWPLFRGNARRTGAAESGGAPLEGGVNWAFASEAKTFYSSPTVVGNRVYATSAEVGVFSNRGAIYCLDADTGGVVWKSVPEGMRATFSSPSVSGKYLVSGEGLHQVRDGRVTCLDITRGGAVLWTFRTKSHVESTPAIADGRAIVGAGDDGYYCFRLEPDAKGNPVLLWHLPGDQYHDAENDPIVHEGRAYLGLGINGQAIVCVDAASGRELWRVATSAPGLFTARHRARQTLHRHGPRRFCQFGGGGHRE